MLFGFCPFESNSIAKLILAVEQEELVIPSSPVISIETHKILKRMLTKNAKHRADWSEIFGFGVQNIDQPKTVTTEQVNCLKESLATTATITLNNKMRSPGKVITK
jgi:hypothetical protein